MGNYSLIPPGRTSLCAAFTLIEVLGTCAIVALLAAIAVPAVKNAKKRANEVRISGNLKTLNEAATRARLEGSSGAGTTGSNKVAAVAWYKTNTYITPEKEVGLNGINFVSGIWYADPYNTDAEFLADLTTGNPPVWNPAKFSDPAKFAALMGRLTTLSDDLILKAATALNDTTQASLVTAQINEMVGSGGAGHDLATLNTALWNVLTQSIYGSGKYYASAQTDKVTFDLSNLTIPAGTNFYGSASQPVRFANTNLTAAQLNSFGTMDSVTFAGFDMTGLNLTAKNVYNASFVGSNVTVAQLNSASNLGGANFSGMNLTGFALNRPNTRDALNLSNATGITGASLNGAGSGSSWSISGYNLQGLNLTGWNPAQSFNLMYSSSTASWTGAVLDLTKTNVTGTQLTQIPTPQVRINVDSANISGWNPTGKNLTGTKIFKTDGSIMTSPAEFMSAIGSMPGPGTRWIDGSLPWG